MAIGRSENMRRIRSKDTSPELRVRRLVHRLGYRFRLHRADLPGKPDLVFPARRKVIFIHGCFWHQHKNCSDGRLPKSNAAYWLPKLTRNKSRDAKHKKALSRLGWSYLVLWECQLSSDEALAKSIRSFLSP
jgi:DNA mismatch endonuclease, patch repair protein